MLQILLFNRSFMIWIETISFLNEIFCWISTILSLVSTCRMNFYIKFCPKIFNLQEFLALFKSWVKFYWIARSYISNACLIKDDIWNVEKLVPIFIQLKSLGHRTLNNWYLFTFFSLRSTYSISSNYFWK